MSAARHADDAVRIMRGLAMVLQQAVQSSGLSRTLARAEAEASATRAGRFAQHVIMDAFDAASAPNAGAPVPPGAQAHAASTAATASATPEAGPLRPAPAIDPSRLAADASPPREPTSTAEAAEAWAREAALPVDEGVARAGAARVAGVAREEKPETAFRAEAGGARAEPGAGSMPGPDVRRGPEDPSGAVSVRGREHQQSPGTKEGMRSARVLREAAVPSSSLGRVLGFGSLAANLAWGAVGDVVSRPFRRQQESDPGRSVLSPRNAEVLAEGLCRMRGAALKLGQMLSIQDEGMLPPAVQAALERVRQGADVMPQWQLEKVLGEELGNKWRERFSEFDTRPMAAASIGQVHRAVTRACDVVAVKVQYPGVAESIHADIDNLMRMLRVANVFPRGMYVEQAVAVAKKELSMECDYHYEAQAQARFRELIHTDDFLRSQFNVPEVFPDLCSRRVLCSRLVAGVPIDQVAQMPSAVRDEVGTRLLRLTLQELFGWRFMQTDPNWGNFLYDPDEDLVHLIDFGAAREYPRAFVDDYMRMVRACAERDRDQVIERSTRLGFLTGDESRVMLDAHVEAGFVVGEPFAARGDFDFGSHNGLTARVGQLGSVMLKHRLTPPPEEAYSLHRKLSGAFLACIKIKARVPCRRLFYEMFDQYEFGDVGNVGAGAGMEGHRLGRAVGG